MLQTSPARRNPARLLPFQLPLKRVAYLKLEDFIRLSENLKPSNYKLYLWIFVKVW